MELGRRPIRCVGYHLVGIATFVFSTLIYFAEKNATEKQLQLNTTAHRWSFIDSLYWCIMTITTVGDNREGPSTTLGQIMGGICAFTGVFVLSLPIPIVVNSFSSYYRIQMWRNLVTYRKKERLAKAEPTLPAATDDMEAPKNRE